MTSIHMESNETCEKMFNEARRRCLDEDSKIIKT